MLLALLRLLMEVDLVHPEAADLVRLEAVDLVRPEAVDLVRPEAVEAVEALVHPSLDFLIQGLLDQLSPIRNLKLRRPCRIKVKVHNLLDPFQHNRALLHSPFALQLVVLQQPDHQVLLAHLLRLLQASSGHNLLRPQGLLAHLLLLRLDLLVRLPLLLRDLLERILLHPQDLLVLLLHHLRDLLVLLPRLLPVPSELLLLLPLDPLVHHLRDLPERWEFLSLKLNHSEPLDAH
jgi:hypothetical protein